VLARVPELQERAAVPLRPVFRLQGGQEQASQELGQRESELPRRVFQPPAPLALVEEKPPPLALQGPG
jgi:hypothetical protein